MTDATISAALLRQAMDAAGLTDDALRAGIAAICMGESAMQGYTERGYAHTDNARIREVFGSRVAELTDAQLDQLKADDRAFFNLVYGRQWGRINLGNRIGTDDGYNFRGRGLIQLTGRGNYTRYAGRIGQPQLIDEPDRTNEPATAAQLAVAYILDRYKGGGFEAMMRCVGTSIGNIAAAKRDYYRRYLASGEFAARAPAAPAGEPKTMPAPKIA